MKKILFTAAIVLGCFVLSSTAQALTLTPGDEIDTGLQTGQAEIDAYLLSNYGLLNLLYKDNDGGSEEGSFTDDYGTVFDPAGDPEDAVITWDGPGTITAPGYLLVKDGNQDPAWYLFDISSWDGLETIFLNDFWPQQGAISHVSIYSGNTPPSEIPEPAAMLLFGTGLVGLAGASRRTRKP